MNPAQHTLLPVTSSIACWPKIRSARIVALLLVIGLQAPLQAQEYTLGQSVDSLLEYAKGNNPEYAAMRYEADAAGERITPAGALPDPKFRTELRDITRFGEQNATLSPSRVGSTKYLLSQDLPWFGKRDLKREIAELDAEGAQGRVRGTWVDLEARIKSAHARLYYVYRNEQLAREILALMQRLEKIAQDRSVAARDNSDACRDQRQRTLACRFKQTFRTELELQRFKLSAKRPFTVGLDVLHNDLIAAGRGINRQPSEGHDNDAR